MLISSIFPHRLLPRNDNLEFTLHPSKFAQKNESCESNIEWEIYCSIWPYPGGAGYNLCEAVAFGVGLRPAAHQVMEERWSGSRRGQRQTEPMRNNWHPRHLPTSGPPTPVMEGPPRSQGLLPGVAMLLVWGHRSRNGLSPPLHPRWPAPFLASAGHHFTPLQFSFRELLQSSQPWALPKQSCWIQLSSTKEFRGQCQSVSLRPWGQCGWLCILEDASVEHLPSLCTYSPYPCIAEWNSQRCRGEVLS